jgi:AraC-like DNA-binding protein
MHLFYKKALLVGFCLLLASVVFGFTCLRLSYLHVALLPAGNGSIPLKYVPGWDLRPDSPETFKIEEDKQRLRFDFGLVKRAAPSHVAVDMVFLDRKGKPTHVDLTRYASISLLVKCSPANTLQLIVPTFEAKVVRPEDYLRYRIPGGNFFCNENESRVELDLTRLETPHWWFIVAQLNLADQAYKLDKVPKIAIGSTEQSPVGIKSSVEISELVLTGRDYRYLMLLGAVLVLAWSGFGLWFFRRHAGALIEDVKVKLQKDLPFVAYQQLSLKPHRDKEKTAILQFLATNYANAELDLDTVVEKTGVNRNKIYDILKTELGFTFSGYLNKLRLTEAARLLAEQDSATVSEIAYSVGSGNVSYFNKLFKEEYGCTPKSFRTACKP